MFLLYGFVFSCYCVREQQVLNVTERVELSKRVQRKGNTTHR